MYHYRDLILFHPKNLRGLFIVYFVYNLYFEKMVSAAQCSQLSDTALHRMLADRVRISAAQCALLLTELRRAALLKSVCGGPAGPVSQDLAKVAA